MVRTPLFQGGNRSSILRGGAGHGRARGVNTGSIPVGAVAKRRPFKIFIQLQGIEQIFAPLVQAKIRGRAERASDSR